MSIENPRRISRRKFGIGAAAAAGSATLLTLQAVLPRTVFARLDEPDIPEEILLQKYLRTIEAEKFSFQRVVNSILLFEDLKDFSLEQQSLDFKMYFPIYKAAELKYGIPWLLLWITHIEETTVSTDEDARYAPTRGAMQRTSEFYDDDKAKEAAKGWEFLAKLEQRHNKSKGSFTSDYEEIFFAAWKLRQDASSILKKYPAYSLEEAILQAMYQYCADWAADKRIASYNRVKPLLKDIPKTTPGNHEVITKN